jgi:hypothetical protein
MKWLIGRAWRAGETITESAMNGEIDFSELQTTDGFTEGLSEDVLKTAEIYLSRKAHRLMKALKYYGSRPLFCRRFTYFGKYLQKNWGSITFTLMNWKL